jgi:hypothetical protein
VGFRFRNRFRLFGVCLHADTHEVVLAESATEGHVTLVAADPEAVITANDRLALEGTGYTTHHDALAAALKWRQYMIDGLASQAISADFGEDPSTRALEFTQENDPPEALARLGFAKGDRLVVDDDRLLVFEAEPEPKLVYGEAFAPTLSIGLVDLQSRLNEVRSRPYHEWSPKVSIAYKLVHSSLRDTNAETRFIQLVTAIEALLPGAERPQSELAVVEELISSVQGRTDLESTVKQSVLAMLANMKQLSIAREAALLLEPVEGDYEGKTSAKFFAECYRLRSKLVHGDGLDLDPGEYGRKYATLLLLVRVVLDKLSLDYIDEASSKAATPAPPTKSS